MLQNPVRFNHNIEPNLCYKFKAWVGSTIQDFAELTDNQVVYLHVPANKNLLDSLTTWFKLPPSEYKLEFDRQNSIF